MILITVFSAGILILCARAFTGGSGSGKAECLGKVALPHMTSVESDSSDRQVNHHSHTLHDFPCPDTNIEFY